MSVCNHAVCGLNMKHPLHLFSTEFGFLCESSLAIHKTYCSCLLRDFANWLFCDEAKGTILSSILIRSKLDRAGGIFLLSVDKKMIANFADLNID